MRIGDRNVRNAGARQVLDALHRDTGFRNPEHQLAARIDGSSRRKDQVFARQFVDVLGVRRGEDVERRSVLDLLRQLRGRAEAESHVDAGFPLEDLAQFSEDLGQVGGGCDVQLRPRRDVRVPAASGSRQRQQQRKVPGHPPILAIISETGGQILLGIRLVTSQNGR